MNPPLADKIEMQNRLFAELSRMFGKEVPLYDKALLVNRECNRTVCTLLRERYIGFTMSSERLDQTSSERHGAVRIGRPDEYRWVARFFAAFALEPHNYYNMSDVGTKSQPIVATAFRSILNPEHRVFCSLLQTDCFDAPTRARVDAVLNKRQVFSPAAQELVEKSERNGGLDWNDAHALIREGADRIFKWTGRAHDHQLYQDLCAAGFKIAADIACFDSHHLNHLTPNTFCMDLYTAAMKLCLEEMDAATFRAVASTALHRVLTSTDRDAMRLLFKHLSREEIEGFTLGNPAPESVTHLVDALAQRLEQDDLQLSTLNHSGFKDFTEGPSEDTPVLLRQDAYKALTEPVRFYESDGSVIAAVHTARFGEVEQRFYATTVKGRDLYDRCLEEAEAVKDQDPGLVRRDYAAFEAAYATPFAPFPKTLRGLLEQHLVYARYTVTPQGLAAAAASDVHTTDVNELVRLGFVQYEGLRYEDFLPVSAAGIVASNLNQYGTKARSAHKTAYTKAMLEEVMGRKIIEADAVYHGLHADSLWQVYEQLGILDRVPAAERAELERAIAAIPAVPAVPASSAQSVSPARVPAAGHASLTRQ